jgi:hypothetical protein
MQGTRLDQGQGLIASYLSSVLYFAYILLQVDITCASSWDGEAKNDGTFPGQYLKGTNQYIFDN